MAVLRPGSTTPYTLFVRPYDPTFEIWGGPEGRGFMEPWVRWVPTRPYPGGTAGRPAPQVIGRVRHHLLLRWAAMTAWTGSYPGWSNSGDAWPQRGSKSVSTDRGSDRPDSMPCGRSNPTTKSPYCNGPSTSPPSDSRLRCRPAAPGIAEYEVQAGAGATLPAPGISAQRLSIHRSRRFERVRAATTSETKKRSDPRTCC